MVLRNAPTGWAAFRAFRQEPAPIPVRHHGNWRHGGYSREGREAMALVRFCARLVRGGPGRLPKLGLRPPRPLGWEGFPRGAGIRQS